jgi:hypothetical protein
MPFTDDANELDLRFFDDRSEFPFLTLQPLEYFSPLTGQTYTVPKYFRTDGASVPVAIAAIPVVGPELLMRYFGHGVFHGFKQGVLHDYLRRKRPDGTTPVPAETAHAVFREALADAGYPSDLVENYFAAVKAFNSD